MEVRYFLDEHIAAVVARELRSRGIDAVTSAEAGRLGRSDTEHLEWAWQAGRAIVTHDADFLRLAGTRPHAGIVYCRQDKHAVGGLLLALERIASDFATDGIADTVMFI